MATPIVIRSNVAEAGATQINNVNFTASYSSEDVDRACLRALRCPDSFAVKTRLKENKDKVVYQSIEWICRTPEYISWHDGDEVSLLWIKGGAGKGKTMMSIGLIEKLLQPRDVHSVITYFFCQNADYGLNTTESIIKGLILQLINQQPELKQQLRDRWDTAKESFREDMASWRGLWVVFLEMLDRCTYRKVFVVVDALDECIDNNMGEFLKAVVRTGLSNSSKIKWLLTSRPLDSAERELLVSPDQVRVSLELNLGHISQAVETYITYKVAELGRRHHYGPQLLQDVESELAKRAEDTYLWVSLVCRRLEGVHRDEVVGTIQSLPPGLTGFYERIFKQISEGDPDLVNWSLRLLKVMMLAYRPLKLAEIGGVAGLSDPNINLEMLVDRCASFVKMRETDVEFVHQSARDYLSREVGASLLGSVHDGIHAEISLSCVSYMSEWLTMNIIGSAYPDLTRDSLRQIGAGAGDSLLNAMDYAATFWAHHLRDAKQTPLIKEAFSEEGQVARFLQTRSLEWLECLSLLDRLPSATKALEILKDSAEGESTLSMIVQDATRFLLRHYEMLATWPAQIYSSAVVFSPRESKVRKANVDKIPGWLTRMPQIEDNWTSVIQTLTGHSQPVQTVAYSPDGSQIASGSSDATIKLWDAKTGQLQRTLYGHSDHVKAVAFSPDGTRIVSASKDSTVGLWDAANGESLMILTGHSSGVGAVASSPDGSLFASASGDGSTLIWDFKTGALQLALKSRPSWNSELALGFSPNGTQIASGGDHRIDLWETRTGDLQRTLSWQQSARYIALVYMPDGKHIISGSYRVITIWNADTGNALMKITGHSDWVGALAISPDGMQFISGSRDAVIRIWNAGKGEVQKTLMGHHLQVSALAFSPDGQQFVSGSTDKTVKIWDFVAATRQTKQADKPLNFAGNRIKTIRVLAISPSYTQVTSGANNGEIDLWDALSGERLATMKGHQDSVRALAFSFDGRQIASGSNDLTIKIWNTATADIRTTLTVPPSTMDPALPPGWETGYDRDGREYFIDHNTLTTWRDSPGTAASWISAVAFSADGTQVVSGSGDGAVRVWSIAIGGLQRTLSGCSSWVTAVAFAHDSSRIAAADDTIKVWKLDQNPAGFRSVVKAVGIRKKTYPSGEVQTTQPVHILRFSADSQHLLTNVGVIKIKGSHQRRNATEAEAVHDLSILRQWLCYNRVPVLRLPFEFRPECYDIRDNHVAVVYQNDQVLTMEIDRRKLAMALGQT